MFLFLKQGDGLFFSFIFSHFFSFAQWAGAVEYTDCINAEE